MTAAEETIAIKGSEHPLIEYPIIIIMLLFEEVLISTTTTPSPCYL